MERNGRRASARYSSPDGRAGGGRERQRNRADGAGSSANGGGQKRNWFARHKIITIVVTVLVLAAAAGVLYTNYIKNNVRSILQNRTANPTVETTDVPETSEPGSPTDSATAEPTATDPTTTVVLADTVNILVLGTDADMQRMNSGRNTTLTDCVMVVSINVKEKKASIISIPRDTYVKMYNDKNKLTSTRNRINAAFGVGGGMKNVDKAILYTQNTVNQFLAKGKIPIDHYVLFNMDFVCSLIDAVGGVDVPVTDFHGIDSDHSKNADGSVTINTDTGKYTFRNDTTMSMSGKMALAYARDRHHTKGGDQGRVKHQQDVIISLLKKLKAGGNMLRVIPDLFTEFQKDIYTDIKSLDEIIAFAYVANGMNLSDIKQYVVPGDYYGQDNMSLLVANQQDKAEIVQTVFGISGTADGSWTKAKLQSEINSKLAAGKTIVSTAQKFLSEYEAYYSSAEAEDLRYAISMFNTASRKNDTTGAEEARQLVQSSYDELRGIVQPRKDAIDAGKSAISSVKSQLNENRGWMTEEQISEINGKIGIVQGFVDSRDYNNIGAAVSDLQSTASSIFSGLTHTAAPTPTDSSSGT